LLWFDAERRSDEVVIQFREGVRSVEMVHLLKRALAKLGASRIVLDFHGFDHLSSKALGKLINLRKKMESSPVRLSIRNIHPDLLEVFKITRLDQMFPIEDV
jgi:anti-sigma B factor antagonist